MKFEYSGYFISAISQGEETWVRKASIFKLLVFAESIGVLVAFSTKT
jgi:hypothetical protein